MSNIFDFNIENNCCGCRACEYSCPQKCIQCKESSSDGFIYPLLSNTNECINCGKCIKVCPIISERKGNAPCSCFSFTSVLPVSDNSASGGAFATVAYKFLLNGGVVYGCAFDDSIEAKTIRINRIEELTPLLSSKYVLCNTNWSFPDIKTDLENGIYTLVCSTPCQIAALYNYLNKPYSNLFTMDLFCHGVPSPGLFRRYKQYLESKSKQVVKKLVFRDKKKGWGTTGYYISDKQHDFLGNEDPYYWNFLKTNTYQKCCYNCPYANNRRVGDISIGDFWGVEIEYPEIDSTSGVSAVLANTDKGKAMIEDIEQFATIRPADFSSIERHNSVLCHPTPYNILRDTIYEAYETTENDILFSEFVKLPYSKIQLFKKKIITSLYSVGLDKVAQLIIGINHIIKK